VSHTAAHVALVGLSGSGKSTVAPLLAQKWGIGLIDIDDQVVATEGRSVSEIFAEDGEDAFRDAESLALNSALNGSPVVIATGGGIVLRPQNRAALSAGSKVVWLVAQIPQLADRLSASHEVRPLLSVGTAERLGEMAQQRNSLYAEIADLTVDVTDRSPSEVVEVIDRSLGTVA